MVYNQVDRKKRVDALRVGAQPADLGAEGGEIGDDGDAGKVLEEDARRKKGKLTRRDGTGRPGSERADVVLRDDLAVEAAEQVLEEHADGERQTADIGEAEFGEAVKTVIRERAGGRFESREGAEGIVRVRHGGFVLILRLVPNG